MFWCMILGFVSLSLYKAKAAKAVKASIDVYNVSYKSCALLWYAKKKESIYTKYLYLLSKKMFLGLTEFVHPNYVTTIGILLSRQT